MYVLVDNGMVPFAQSFHLIITEKHIIPFVFFKTMFAFCLRILHYFKISYLHFIIHVSTFTCVIWLSRNKLREKNLQCNRNKHTFLLQGNDKFIFYTFITICRFCNSFLKNHLIMRNERQLRKILWINSMGGRIWCFSSCRSVASSLRKKVFHSIFFRLLVTGLQLVFQA